MNIGQKIIILGCPGSGKSTLAMHLHDLTGLPLIHLDTVWWKPDRTHIARDEFDKRLTEVLSGSRWIIDGDYSRTYEVRIQACDTVIFLDYDEETCMNGICERIGTKRPDIPWTETKIDPELTELVKKYRYTNRPVILELLKKYSDKHILIFKTRNETEYWLMDKMNHI